MCSSVLFMEWVSISLFVTKTKWGLFDVEVLYIMYAKGVPVSKLHFIKGD